MLSNWKTTILNEVCGAVMLHYIQVWMQKHTLTHNYKQQLLIDGISRHDTIC